MMIDVNNNKVKCFQVSADWFLINFWLILALMASKKEFQIIIWKIALITLKIHTYSCSANEVSRVQTSQMMSWVGDLDWLVPGVMIFLYFLWLFCVEFSLSRLIKEANLWFLKLQLYAGTNVHVVHCTNKNSSSQNLGIHNDFGTACCWVGQNKTTPQIVK